MSEAHASVPAHGPDRLLDARRGRTRGLVALARPRQWIKNGLVVAAAGAAGALGRDDVLGRVLAAAAALCLISAAIYAVNDVVDRHEDRHHPRKRRRPVAAGELSPRSALLAAAVWMASGLGVCVTISPWLAIVALGYAALTLSYTMLWRGVPVLDLVALAAGFVLRAVAGGAAAPVQLSRSFLFVVTFAALFAAAGKRFGELVRTRAAGLEGRPVMRHYRPGGLRALIVCSGVGAVGAYAVWAMSGSAVQLPWRPLTLAPFVVSLARYGWLAGRGAAETPEQVALRDRPLALAGACWVVLFALSVDAAA